MTLRDRIITHALASVGLGADPAHLAAFAAFLGGPGEGPGVAHSMATDPHSSTCALCVRRWLSDAGVVDPRLEPPYADRLIKHGSNAFSDVLALADERGAWVPFRPGTRPKVGDIFVLNRYASDSGTSGHMGVVGELTAPGMIALEGGQLDDAGRQCIKRREHVWGETGGKLLDTARGSRTRSLDGWIDVDRLDAPTGAQATRDGARAASEVIAASPGPVAIAGSEVSVRLEPVAPPATASLEFIDLSDANMPLDPATGRRRRPDYVRIRASGILGVWFHALEGNEDPAAAAAKLMPEVNAARAAGLLTGVYQEVYPRHGKPQDADVQARQLAELHHRLGCELLPWAVHEDVRGDAIRMSAAERAECVAAARLHRSSLCAALEREGLLYSGPGYWNVISQGLDVSDFADALLVVADYELRAAPQLPRGFKRAVMWQYAGGAGVIGHVDGVATVVDRTRGLAPLETFLA